MKQQQINLKNKIYNYIMKNGNKDTCEKKMLKNLKLLQKNSKKSHINLIKLAIINSSPIVQLRQIKKKKRKSIKEFPYVLNINNRISLGIKQIIGKKMKMANNNFYEEILLFSKKKSDILKTKEAKHKLALIQKKYIFFRWFF